MQISKKQYKIIRIVSFSLLGLLFIGSVVAFLCLVLLLGYILTRRKNNQSRRYDAPPRRYDDPPRRYDAPPRQYDAPSRPSGKRR